LHGGRFGKIGSEHVDFAVTQIRRIEESRPSDAADRQTLVGRVIGTIGDTVIGAQAAMVPPTPSYMNCADCMPLLVAMRKPPSEL
jgi:hypothetical protein